MDKRRVGIPGIENTDWGEHICVFFYTKDELLKLTVPYIKAGLENNELCMWTTGGPITESDAFCALEEVLPDAHQFLIGKQLEILPHTQWNLSSGIFEPQLVLSHWVSKARHAQAKGFEGLRITGNPFWLTSDQDWEQSGAYEQAFTQTISNQPVLALCTYPGVICESNHIVQVLSSHRSTLIADTDRWQRYAIPQPYTPSTERS
jgi:hypothetical protein